MEVLPTIHSELVNQLLHHLKKDEGGVAVNLIPDLNFPVSVFLSE